MPLERQRRKGSYYALRVVQRFVHAVLHSTVQSVAAYVTSGEGDISIAALPITNPSPVMTSYHGYTGAV